MVQNTASHECVIGVLDDYENSHLVALSDLKIYIADNARLISAGAIKNAWSLADYADKRKSTDFTRFEYCPYCGKKIDWSAIRKAAVNNAS